MKYTRSTWFAAALAALAAVCTAALASLAAGCTSFNRDALWNAPIPDEYCTYYAVDFPPGSLFVHSQNDWTEKRLAYRYELKVLGEDAGWLILDHGWAVLDSSHDMLYQLMWDKAACHAFWPNPRWMQTEPIAVKVLDPDGVKVGDLFTVYGQYRYLGLAPRKFNGKTFQMKHLQQINSLQDAVAEPYPFVYFR